jgi:hypothetical protein
MKSNLLKANKRRNNAKRKIGFVHGADPERYLEVCTELEFELHHYAQLECQIETAIAWLEGATDPKEIEAFIMAETQKELSKN